MQKPRLLCSLFVSILCAFAAAARADDVSPVVVNPIDNISVTAGTAATVVKLKNTFGLSGVSGPLVRFSTSAGNIDVELFPTQAPQTVATFLGYAETAGDNNSGVASYTNTLIQRSVPGFIIQGGGYFVSTASQITLIPGRPDIPSEAGISNTRGTIAMALSTGPGTATGEWFFNLVDNPGLDDTSDDGPFTVFGHIVAGISAMDAIAALPRQDFSSQLGQSFSTVPLINYDGVSTVKFSNLVYTNSISPVAIVGKHPGDPSILTLKISNDNPGLVSASLSGEKLILIYTAGAKGTANLRIKAVNPGAASKAKASFTVTVE